MIPASAWIGSTRNAAVLRPDRRAQFVEVAEVDEPEARGVGPEILAILRLRREADDRRRAAVEVVAAYDDLGAVVWHALHAVRPLARELDRRLDRFGAGVHRQRHLEAREPAKLREERSHAVVVHGARGERELARLLDERADDSRMAVSLIQRRVRADAIEILPAFDVPSPDAFGARDHDRQRRIVRRAHALRLGDQLGARVSLGRRS